MNKSESFRDYENRDYHQCEMLVNEAWAFDENFRPQGLADIAKLLYTKGSVLNSNYKKVVEIEGDVAGFIFGFNELSDKQKNTFLFGLKILWKLYRVKPIETGDKKKLLKALADHEKNRSKLVDRGKSEIVLFVVGKKYQGLGYGKKLWSGFLSHCKQRGVKSIFVETNRLGASSFYEQLGFIHVGDFDSPLHEYATKGGQACMYEYEC